MSSEKDEDTLSPEEEEEVGAEDESDENFDEFSCKYCDFLSGDIDELDEHIISHDEAILEDGQEEEADTAESSRVGVNPSSIAALKNKENYGIDQTPKRRKQSAPAFYDEYKNKADKRVFVCPYCGYQSMRKLDMNKHVKVHRKPVELPVYACSECSYTTRRKCDMPKHLLTHCKDGSVPMHKCVHCPYATKRKGDLPKHMLCHEKQDADTYLRCHRCVYSTRRRGDLKKHLLSHEHDNAIIKNNIFSCTECGYTSKRLNDLHKHVILHCEKAEKGIFKCKKCEYSTGVSTHFAKHVLSNCEIIDAAFFSKDAENMQDYIVLNEDELHLYQIEKEGFTPVDVTEKDAQVAKTSKKRKRTKEDSFASSQQSNLDHYYVEDDEDLEESDLVEKVGYRGSDKVLVLAGYEGGDKTGC